MKNKINKVQSKKSKFKNVNAKTNIKVLDLNDTWLQLTSGDEEAPLIQAMKSAKEWGSGAIAKAGGAAGIKKWAEKTGEATLKSRIGAVQKALPSGAPAKQDMPALEGEDGPAVADALAPGGEFNIDLATPFSNDQENFDAWYNALPPEARKKLEAGVLPTADEIKAAEASLSEEKFPRYGHGPFPGVGAAPEGAKGATGQKDVVGKALAFLTKGMLDGSGGDDRIDVKLNQKDGLANSSMKPTQSNILAAKSLLFAFLHGTGNNDLTDMGGAFVTTDNKILDGHHRWSGALIATGGNLTHSGVHIVGGDANTLIPMLVSVGNALGRTQKGIEKEKNESMKPLKTKDNIILERWKRLAGLL